ncbi:MAG TPA: hypothetical protein VD973_17165 [Symbiobacteriaceae bacterium]|nr:hypothetical protein [Symbiobacteriaceae bacterium]
MINALPSSLRAYVPRIESVISKWPVKITLEHAIKWVMQFDAEDQALAVRVLEHIHVLGSKEIRDALEVAHAKLERMVSEKGAPIRGNNTLYAGIGNAAKSGGLIAYHYRVAAEISENDFFSSEEERSLDLSKIENIVLVDDVIGTGKTIKKEVTRIAEEVYTLSKTRNVFVLTVAGYEEGIQYITNETGASVVCALEYTSKDTVSNLDASFYKDMPVSDRSIDLDRIKRYCRSISTSELGFGGVGGLLVFDHNTPNTTLPIIWHNGKGWLPLFPRATRIPGAAKIIRSAENERNQPTPEVAGGDAVTESGEAPLTLFVEGKIDEVFVDCMRQRYDLAGRIGVKEVNAIALGGLYQSERLLDLLKTSRKNAVFVLDDDEHARRASSRLVALENVKILRLKPTFAAMLDFQRVFQNRDRFPDLPESFGSVDDPKFVHAVEAAVLKRWPVSANSERITQVIDEFLDQIKYSTFVAELKAVVAGHDQD